jgi:hypothetical protein
MSKAKYEEYPAHDTGVFTQSFAGSQLDVLYGTPPMPSRDKMVPSSTRLRVDRVLAQGPPALTLASTIPWVVQ